MSASRKAVRPSLGILFLLTLESHSFSVLMLMNDTSPLAPVITPSCSQRTMRSISSPSFHLRYLPISNQLVISDLCSPPDPCKHSAKSFPPLIFSLWGHPWIPLKIKLLWITLPTRFASISCWHPAPCQTRAPEILTYLYATEATSFLSMSSSTKGFGLGNLYFSFPCRWKQQCMLGDNFPLFKKIILL